MRYVANLVLFSICSLCMSQEVRNLQIQPIDFHESSEVLPGGIFQLLADEGRIYTRFRKDPFITMLDHTGQPVGRIGRAGSGPGEFAGGLVGMAVRGDELWAIDANRPELAQQFISGSFMGLSIKLDTYPMSMFAMNANRFDFSEDYLVYPVMPWKGALAHAYPKNGDGPPIKVGQLVFTATEKDMLAHNPALNDTAWFYEAPNWICVFRYFPLIQVYDLNFQLTKSVQLDHIAPIDQRFQTLFDKKRYKAPAQTLFSDIFVTDQAFFLMSRSALFQVSREGELMNMYQFMNRDERLDVPMNASVNFFWFTIIGEQTLVLSNYGRWGRDLWKADLGQFSQR